MKKIVVILSILMAVSASAQSVPAEEENIPFLVTFGAKGDKSWGDDDHSQTFFFVVPEEYKFPFYIRVFDPGTGGKHDEKKGEYNTSTKFSVYGGKGCITNKASKATDPIPGHNSGNLLASKTFTTEHDDGWYAFGPFNPTSGELVKEYGGNVVKMIIEGKTGDDGNLYRLFMSTLSNSNKAVEGGNAFTFEYTFRMHNDPSQVSHVYPYIDSEVLSVKQGNYDWDFDGDLKIVTRVRYGFHLKKSGDANWGKSEHKISPKEKDSSFDVQFHKNKTKPIHNNNIVFYITNQYGVSLPFYTIPIGGIPKPKAKPGFKPKG